MPIGMYMDWVDGGRKSPLTLERIQAALRNSFEPHRASRARIYKLVEVRPDEVLKTSAFVCVRVPGSQLKCQVVEEMLAAKSAMETQVENLTKELGFLKKLIARSETVRKEALGTVNLLREEFNHLIDDSNQPQKIILPKLPTSPPNSVYSRSFAVALPKLPLTARTHVHVIPPREIALGTISTPEEPPQIAQTARPSASDSRSRDSARAAAPKRVFGSVFR